MTFEIFNPKTAVVEKAIQNETVFGEAINLQDNFTTPHLEKLKDRERHPNHGIRGQYRRMYDIAFDQKMAWLKQHIVQYSMERIPPEVKDKIAKEVGEYFLNSSINYLIRVSKDID